ncbi:MAG: ABC-2 family transporter protein [Planctomycetaceae bacterium]
MSDATTSPSAGESLPGPNYWRVWKTFARNAIIREMTFRGNFLITVATRALWFCSQLVMFKIVFSNVSHITPGWNEYQYFAFMATGMLINAVIEALFMPNCANFSELIRTGNLDFALLKPIDTQFLISFEKMDLAMLNQVLLAVGLLVYSLTHLPEPITLTVVGVLLYLLFIGLGVTIFYSLMIALASTTIWFGRNQGLYDFWFYITVFARYPRSIYETATPAGDMIRFTFTCIVPILVVVTVPARLLLQTLGDDWRLAVIGAAAAISGLIVSRLIFNWSLRSYRSASS